MRNLQETDIVWAPPLNDVLHVRSKALSFGTRDKGTLMPLLVKVQEVTANDNDPIIIVVGVVEPKRNNVDDGITIPPAPYLVVIFFDDRNGKGSLHTPRQT